MNEHNYIIDSFSKEGEQTNLEINNLKATCITSTNNKFELDSDGNLTVKTLTTEEGILPTQAMLNYLYPIGSIYMSVNDTNPTTIFGGAWERIEDVFLYAASTDFPLGSTGGEKEVTLTVAQMPSHNHRFQAQWEAGRATGVYWTYNADKNTGVHYTTNTGGNQPHNNMPPYLAVYIWKRIQ